MAVATTYVVNISLYQASAAMNANARWQEVISENLASSSIPGFKRQDLSFSAVQAGLMPQGAGAQKLNFVLPQAQATTSFAPGDLKYTGSKTDVAIEGSGFFEVQLANGASAYTRDGEFQINSQGQLATKQGQVVLGDGGPIQLDRNNTAPLSISPSGEVSQGMDRKGRLRIMEFNDLRLLTPIGGGSFMATNPSVQASEVRQPAIRHGFLESANTSPVNEMGNLIGVMRSFEANQRVVQINDERMGRAISELGNPS